MSEFPSEKKSHEVQKVRSMSEHMAEFRAMPLRSIAALEPGGKIAWLDCGHRKALLVWLLVGDFVRCRDCFNDGMMAAGRLIDGSRG